MYRDQTAVDGESNAGGDAERELPVFAPALTWGTPADDSCEAACGFFSAAALDGEVFIANLMFKIALEDAAYESAASAITAKIVPEPCPRWQKKSP
jgi:hypothetical protein